MNNCPKCGSTMVGDGYTRVLHCEMLEDIPLDVEPDAEPILCNFEEENEIYPIL